MAEYIEREAAKKILAFGVGVTAANALDNVPAADVVPVVHGRLVLRTVSDVTSTFMCSECGREFEVANTYFRTPTNYPNKNYPYCNCGARMDGDGK